MTIEQAKRIAGNQPTWALKNMVKALSLHQWLNDAEDTRRLAAAKFILRARSNTDRV